MLQAAKIRNSFVLESNSQIYQKNSKYFANPLKNNIFAQEIRRGSRKHGFLFYS